MRVLWFSVTPSLYNPFSNAHNGGGWIASLEKIIRDESSVELGVAFNFNEDQFKNIVDGVSYYPIKQEKQGVLDKFLKREDSNRNWGQYHKIIEDFKPDVIQIFGSENEFGVICKHTDIPVVIHMQGSIPPYHNALFPIGMNTYDFLFTSGLSWNRRLMGLLSERSFRHRAEREIETIKSCRYFMGRTEWDHALVSLFNPTAKYFHCEEALRDSFLSSDVSWSGHKRSKINIVSVISNPWYKGVDLILKTAKLLTEFTDLDFEWNLYGVSDIRFMESKYGIKAKDVNIQVNGSVSKDKLVEALLDASCYVHSSYIDNSPNSLCEAQILGLPIIATNVGGISSLVKDGESGILFPANDPYMLAHLIKQVVMNDALALKLGLTAQIQARKRHDVNSIKESLMSVYSNMLSDGDN